MHRQTSGAIIVAERKRRPALAFLMGLAVVLVAPGMPARGLAQQNEVVRLPPVAASYPAVVDAALDLEAFAPAADTSPDLEARVANLEETLEKAAAKEKEASQKGSGKPTLNATGVLDVDTAAFSQNAASRVQFPPGVDVFNGVGFRRARLGLYGEAYDVCFYRIEMDFAPFIAVANATNDASVIVPDPAMKSTFFGLRDLPLLGNVRIGHVKEPFSLDHLTRDRYGTFMERALVDDANFVPRRSPGVVVDNHAENERMTWHFGAFVPDLPESPPVFIGNHGGIAFTGRYTALPWCDEASNSSQYVHTGIAYSWRQNATGSLLYAARPESSFGPVIVTTAGQLTGDNADVDHNQLLGAEFALVRGPLCLQGEYYWDFVARRLHPDAAFSGYYAYVTYFLTGEHKPYDRKAGHFDRVIPLNNFSYYREDGRPVVKGWGAWLLAYRYATLDLDDNVVQGGAAAAHTIGLNWYLNPYTRFMFNYVICDVNRLRNGVSQGLIDVFELRCHIDF